jgi:hypothetical protein
LKAGKKKGNMEPVLTLFALVKRHQDGFLMEFTFQLSRVWEVERWRQKPYMVTSVEEMIDAWS